MVSQEHGYAGGEGEEDDGTMIMAPLLVEKLTVRCGLTVVIPRVIHGGSSSRRKLTREHFLGSGHLLGRHEEASGFGLPYCRGGGIYAEEAIMYCEGDQRSEGGENTC